MDNSGGAKPKTMSSTATNNNNGHSSQQASTSSSSTQATTPAGGAAHQPRHRSQRMENGFIPRSSGRASRSMRNYAGGGGGGSSSGSSGMNGYGSRPSPEDGSNRRGTAPPSSSSAARAARHSSSTQTRTSHPQRVSFTDYSPLRGGANHHRLEARSLPWQNGNPEFRRRSLRYLHPVPRIGESLLVGPLESPTGDVYPPMSPCLNPPPPVSPSLHGILSSSEDSDSESGSPMSPPGSSQLQSPGSSSADSLALPQANGDRPMGLSRDAVIARELLQSEMDMMMQRDEEMARQLQDDSDDDDSNVVQPCPLSMLLNSAPVPPRRHRYPNMARRLEGGYSRQPRDRWGFSSPRFLHSSPERSEANAMHRPPPGTNPFGMSRARGAESSGMGWTTLTDGEGRRRRLRTRSPDVRRPSASYDEFDPDDPLLAGGLEPPDDFLSMMVSHRGSANDPTLMLLMHLLRAPDSLYQNEAGVDLDDYEALWDLAEQLGEVRRRGITEEEISLLPTRKYKPQGEEGEEEEACNASAPELGASLQCQICLVDFENGDCLRCIPCKHDFHRDCLDEWLKRNATCPICRQDIKPQPDAK